MIDSILTLHPEGKPGVNIGRQKYDLVRRAILEAINTHGELTLRDLVQVVNHKISANFYGSIPWYVANVQLDLEARREIERVPKSRPQCFRLAQVRDRCHS